MGAGFPASVMKSRLRIQKRFPRDLQRAIDSYESVSESLADRFCQSLESKLISIETMPESYPLLRENVRGAPLKPFPWMVMFEVRKDATEILRLVHTASEW